MNARLWNSFAISGDQELQLGFNYLQGNPSAIQMTINKHYWVQISHILTCLEITN